MNVIGGCVGAFDDGCSPNNPFKKTKLKQFCIALDGKETMNVINKYLEEGYLYYTTIHGGPNDLFVILQKEEDNE